SAGPTGLGLVGPSVFGIGILPPVQVPTAQPLQALDGINAAALVNRALVPPVGGVPTQLADIVTVPGLPNNGDAVTAAVNPALSTAMGTFGPQITKALNGAFGPAATEIARRFVALAEAATQASQAIPPVGTPNGSGLPVSTPPAASVPNNLLTSAAPAAPSVPLPAVAELVEDINVPEELQPRKRPRLSVNTRTPNPGESAAVGSRTSTNRAGTNGPGGLRSTVRNAPERVTDAVSGTVKSATDTVRDKVGSLGKLGKAGNDDG
ncbi:MAG TPA: hypothetical protein VGA66_07655, partial [Mycobacterium sp.]